MWAIMLISKNCPISPIEYRVMGVWNFPHPVSEVAAVALDFDKTYAYFSIVFRLLTAYRTRNPKTSRVERYIVREGRGSASSAWQSATLIPFLLDRLFLTLPVYCVPRWKTVYLSRSVESSGAVLKIFGPMGPLCRVIVGPVRILPPWNRGARAGRPNRCLQWLVRMAMNIILPQLFRNIESEVHAPGGREKPKETGTQGITMVRSGPQVLFVS